MGIGNTHGDKKNYKEISKNNSFMLKITIDM